MFCKHKWQIVSETVTKSKFEVAMEAVGEGSHRLPHQLSDASRKHIQTFTCSKCGELRRFVEKI